MWRQFEYYEPDSVEEVCEHLARQGDEAQILAGGTGRGLRDAAIEEGMPTLRRSGLRKIAQGVTSIDEVTRETVR